MVILTEVTVRGEADAKSGIVIDLGLFERALGDWRDGLGGGTQRSIYRRLQQ